MADGPSAAEPAWHHAAAVYQVYLRSFADGNGDGAPGFGFGPADGTSPWLPQPDAWRQLAADTQAQDGGSMLALYRSALHIRRTGAYLSGDAFGWLDAPDGVLVFSRGANFGCAVNISGAPVLLPPHDELMLTSAPLESGLLPPDAAAWLRLSSRS